MFENIQTSNKITYQASWAKRYCSCFVHAKDAGHGLSLRPFQSIIP